MATSASSCACVRKSAASAHRCKPAFDSMAVASIAVADQMVIHVMVSTFKTKARLEAEIIMLRHQLNVLRRRVPSKPRLAGADRLLFVCSIACSHRC